MKGADAKAAALPLLAEIAGRAEAAKDHAALAESLQPAVKQGWCQRAYVAIFNGDSASIREPGGKTGEFPLQGSSLETAKAGNPYVDNGIGKYSGYYDERNLAGEGFTSYLCTPLKDGASPLGALCLARKDSAFFTQEDSLTAALAASYLASALSRIELSKRAETSQELSSMLLEKAAAFMMVATLPKGEIVAANTGAEVISGYSASELTHRKLAQLFHGDIVGQMPESGLFRFVRKNGDERVLDLRLGFANREKGGFVVLTGTDATEKLNRESNYKDVVESISDIVFTANSDGEIISINEEVERMLGRKRDSLIGTPLGGFVYEQDYKVLSEALHTARDIRSVELRLLTGNNEPRWFELNGRCYRDSASNLLRITGVLRDIHERKRSSEYASLVANVTEQSSDAIVAMDTNGIIRFWNKGAESLFGYLEKDIQDRPAYLLYPDDKQGELDSLIRRLNESGGRVVDYDTERVKKGGEQVIVRIFASVMKNAEGQVERYVEIIKDLTSQTKVADAEKKQKELEEKNKYLREVDREKSEFVSSVSHELRTPLTNIHGYSSLLADEEAGSMNDEQKKYVSIIHSETERLTRLINDLLEKSRMERGKFKISPVMFDLRNLAERCSCSATAEKKGLYVKWEFAEDVPLVYGDPARISQVVLNLVSNAVKFTDLGGVTVRVSRPSRTLVQVDVIDTGIGISEENQKRLFKPFSQITPQETQKRGGSGLGLTISKGIVQLHGGKMGVESKVGSGSRFWFTIRAQPPRKSKAGAADAGVSVQ